MTKDDIVKLAIEHTVSGLKFDEDGLVRFAKLIAEDERKFCIQFLIELHGAQLGKNNLYAYAAQALSELNGRELPNKFSLNIRNNK
jgi:hypothetical protein